MLVSPLPDPKGNIRWFTAHELAEAMGYPISEEAQRRAWFSCQFSRGQVPPATRSRNSFKHQLGNGWHIGVFAVSSFLNLLQNSELGRPLHPPRVVPGPFGSTAIAMRRLREARSDTSSKSRSAASHSARRSRSPA